MFQSQSLCFHTNQTIAFSFNQANAYFMANILRKKKKKKLSIGEDLLLNFIVIKETILLIRYFDKSVLFDQFFNTFTMLTTSNSLVQSNARMTSLRLRGKICRDPPNTLSQNNAFGPSESQIHCFGNPKLSSFEIVIGHLMYLASASFDQQWTKGEMFQAKT